MRYLTRKRTQKDYDASPHTESEGADYSCWQIRTFLVWKSIFSLDGRFIEGCSNPSETEGVRRSTILSNEFDSRPLRFIVRQFCRTSSTHGRSASSFDKVVVQFVERVRPTAAPVLRVTVSPNGFDPQPLRPVVQRFHTGFTRIPHGLHRDFTWMSQGFQKDLKGFYKN